MKELIADIDDIASYLKFGCKLFLDCNNSLSLNEKEVLCYQVFNRIDDAKIKIELICLSNCLG